MHTANLYYTFNRSYIALNEFSEDFLIKLVLQLARALPESPARPLGKFNNFSSLDSLYAKYI